jgi:hypothetical protein
MLIRRVIGTITMIAGLAAILVGVLHFVLSGHLDRYIAAQLDAAAAARIIPVFHVNHLGSGVFLILLGAILAQTGYAGLLSGKTWGAALAVLIGTGFTVLAVILWTTVPAEFLTAGPFQIALGSLAAVGVLTALPPLMFWGHFREA